MEANAAQEKSSTDVKACGCGRSYTADSFAQLQLKGWIGCSWRGGKARAVELRNCTCGSTIGMECDAPPNILKANARLRGAA